MTKNIIIIIIYLLVCLNISKCLNVCTVSDRYCKCDDKCTLYGDCCPGHPNFNSTGTWKDILICKDYSLLRKIWLVDRCADNNHPLAKYCSRELIHPNGRLRSQIPVISDDYDTYSNAFCAQCNGRAHYRYINVTVSCMGFMQPRNLKEAMEFVNGRRICRITPIHSEYLRYCSKHVVRDCPRNYQSDGDPHRDKIIDNCERRVTDFEEVTDSQTIYRNQHCCICWNKTCFPSFNRRFDPFTIGSSYLLNFNDWKEEVPPNSISSNKTDSTNATSFFSKMTPINYISIVITLVSIVSLIVLLAIYTYNTIFHNFGGYLTICLSICQLLMHILSLVKIQHTESTIICKWFGILKHFVAICTFVWMAIYALDLVQTFGFNTMNRNKRKSFKTFLVYCLVGFGISTVIVGSATVTEFYIDKNSTLAPNYGGVYCFFRSSFAGLVWFLLPICLLLLWNCVTYVVVIYKLTKTAQECRVVQDKESHTTLWLCIRLTAVFGIGYIIQIVVAFTEVYELIVVAVLLSDLQGFLLAACFVWTKRVKSIVTSVFTNQSDSNTTSQKQSTKLTRISKDPDNLQSVHLIHKI